MTPPDDHNWQPVTFRERGVAVGFTNPLLAGARIRHAERRCELVVPHPGGARGVYIFAIGALAEFCVPTLHDHQLAERLAGLGAFCPATVREAARAVAAGGAAGRAAMSAARHAAELEAQDAACAQKLLFLSILRQDGLGMVAPDSGASEAVLSLARRTGRDADAVRADIMCLAQTLARSGIGIPGADDARGRAGRLLDLIGSVRSSILGWAGAGPSDGPGSTVTQMLSCMHAAGQHLLLSSHALLADHAALLRAWASNPEAVAARLGRLQWLLDGWEHLCLLWQVAETDDQRAEAMGEMAAQIPPLPTEAELWLGDRAELLAPLRQRRQPAGPGGLSHRLPSQIVALVARNERIRAKAA